MTPPPDLDSLSHEDMKSLILTLLARMAELAAQLGKQPKNSSNSSVPPPSKVPVCRCGRPAVPDTNGHARFGVPMPLAAPA